MNNAIGTSVWGWNANNLRHRLGGYAYPSNDTTRGLDGYMAEVNFIDGALVASNCDGETKDLWIPKKSLVLHMVLTDLERHLQIVRILVIMVQ